MSRRTTFALLLLLLLIISTPERGKDVGECARCCTVACCGCVLTGRRRDGSIETRGARRVVLRFGSELGMWW